MKNIVSSYDFRLIEDEVSSRNLNLDFEFVKSFDSNYKFSMLLPPPNITGELHMGHALNLLLQDFFVRYFNQKGNFVNWCFGVDHAGIALQNLIDFSKNKKNDSVSEKINYILNDWYPTTLESFKHQWNKLGVFSNFSNINFTFDEFSKIQVNRCFVRLYNDGIIHNSTRIVNFDIKLNSFVSDIETETRDSTIPLYYLKYEILNSPFEEKYISVATTRPETIFSDVALFVNPNDARYRKFIGFCVKSLFSDEKLPIIADEYVNIDFGTGVLKCTPGHDNNDYLLAKKHKLPIFSCCDERGILNKSCGIFSGKKINDIREELVSLLLEKNICFNTEFYDGKLIYSSRSNTIIEPILSKQWFIDLNKMLKLIEKKNPRFLNEIQFYPNKFFNIISEWKNKLSDWCISRQLWWGHRIPVWHKENSFEIYVGEENPNLISNNDGLWIQERDVLDTWFSSSLWALICSFDRKNKNIKNFPNLRYDIYPFTFLVTGKDIIFFWVLKMILLSFYFCNTTPFKNVFLHGLIKDEKGRKMSKTLGNGINPLNVINNYGSDSLRLFIFSNFSWGNDLNFQENKVSAGWRFCQKILSITNLYIKLFSDINEIDLVQKEIIEQINTISCGTEEFYLNIWMLSKFLDLKKDVNGFFLFKNGLDNNWNLNIYVNKLLSFVREEFSNKYLQLLSKSKCLSKFSKLVFSLILQGVLILLYPIIPNISQYIFFHLGLNAKFFLFKNDLFKNNIENILSVHYVNIWLIDVCFKIIDSTRKFKKKNYSFFLEIEEYYDKNSSLINSFNFSFFVPLIKKNNFTLQGNKNDFNFCLELSPFGILWYNEHPDIFLNGKKANENSNSNEGVRSLQFYLNELKRAENFLNNKSFVLKAPKTLVEKEEKKYKFYKNIIENLKKNNNK